MEKEGSITLSVVASFGEEGSGVAGWVAVVGCDIVVGWGVAVGSGDAIAEQAFSPSSHVCSNLVSPGCPHFPRQEPPLPQQVSPPLAPRPHLGHAEDRKIIFSITL